MLEDIRVTLDRFDRDLALALFSAPGQPVRDFTYHALLVGNVNKEAASERVFITCETDDNRHWSTVVVPCGKLPDLIEALQTLQCRINQAHAESKTTLK